MSVKPPPTWLSALAGLLLGAMVGVVCSGATKKFKALPPPAPSLETAWRKLPPRRRAAIARNHKKYSGMTPAEQRFVRDRWQYYRHLPAWRQAEMLREFDALRKKA